MQTPQIELRILGFIADQLTAMYQHSYQCDDSVSGGSAQS
jgi:hypothetical protein